MSLLAEQPTLPVPDTDAGWFQAQTLPAGGHTGLAVGTHSETVSMLTDHGFAPVSVADLAGQRLQLGGYHPIAWTGSRTTDLLIVDGDRVLLAHGDPDSDLWQPDTAHLFARFHAEGHEIPLDHDAVLDTIEIPSTNFEVPVEDLADHPVARFLLGNTVGDYQRWLADLSIPYWPFMLPPVSFTRHHPYPFMRPVIMRCTDNWSGLITTNTDLHAAYGTRAHHPDGYSGPVTPEETFTAAAVAPVAPVLNIKPGNYALTELVTAAGAAGTSHLLGVVLRFLRNTTDLPATHTTWAPDTTNGDPS